MAMNFINDAEAQKGVQDRLDTRQWWLIPVVDVEGFAFVEKISTRFYTGEDSKLLEALMVVGPTADVPCLFLILAAKRCMSPAQLAELTGQFVPADGSRDILVPTTTPLSVMVWLYTRFRWPVAKS